MINESHIDLLTNFLDSELSEYSWFKYEIDPVEDGEETIVEVKVEGKDGGVAYLHMRTDGNILEIEMNEDMWEETNDFSWRVKYFWMALLNWDLNKTE